MDKLVVSAPGAEDSSKREGLDAAALDLLFRNARSHNGWLSGTIGDETLRRSWDLVKWGPTSANSSPMRIMFLRSESAKERLRPFLQPANVRKTMTAPVVAIIGTDSAFFSKLPQLFPHNPDAPTWFEGEANREHAERTAQRNSSLQGAYFMIAVRALGLDCGPISGFDHGGVDRTFWAGTSVKTNFICNIGYGDPTFLFPRLPRLSFEDACTIL